MTSDKISKLLGGLGDALTLEYGDKETDVDVSVMCIDASTYDKKSYVYTVTIEATQTDKFYHD